MRALVVIAHPSPHSLTAALADETCHALRDAGHSVQTSPLYDMGWSPAVRLEDFGQQSDHHLPVGDQATEAYANGTLTADIREEHQKIAEAELLIFHFPLWWYGMPAMLKGWFDRVLVNGFAYGVKDEHGRTRKYGDGGLTGKRALAVITAGDRATSFDPRGLNGEAQELFFPFLHGIFWYTGMQPLAPHLVAGVDRPGWDRYEAETERLRARLAQIETEQAIAYRALADGDYDADRRLRDEFRSGETGLSVHLE